MIIKAAILKTISCQRMPIAKLLKKYLLLSTVLKKLTLKNTKHRRREKKLVDEDVDHISALPFLHYSYHTFIKTGAQKSIHGLLIT